MFRFVLLNAFLLLSIFLMSQVSSGEEVEKTLKLNGTLNYFRFDSAQSLPDKMLFYGVSNGELSSVLEVIAIIPKKAKLKVEASKIYKSAEYTKKHGRFFGLSLSSEKETKARQKECLSIGVSAEESDDEKDIMLDPSEFPAIDDPRCDLFTKEELSKLAETFSLTFGGTWSVGNICAYLVEIMGEVDLSGKNPFVTPTPTSLPVAAAVIPTKEQVKRIRGFSLFRKDTCDSRAKKYLLKVSVDFKRVKEEKPQGEVTLMLRVNEFKQKEGRPAALKPESDGRYAPRPIFLMNWLGSTCGNEIDVSKWKNGKPAWSVGTKPYSLFLYKNIILSASLADKALRGGSGTVTLSNGYEAYSVCFDLARKRQNKNGYPR